MRGTTATFNNDVCNGPVKRITGDIKLLKPRFWVGYAQERARPIVPRTLPKNVRHYVEVNHDTTGGEQRPVFRSDHRPTACGKNDVRFVDQRFECLGLPPSKSVLPFDFEDGWDFHASSRLDFVVAVNKTPSEPLGEFTSDSRFAGTRHANEDDTSQVLRIHGRYGRSRYTAKSWPISGQLSHII